MAWTEDERWRIFQKTDGRCHICRKRLCFNNRRVGERGAWQVDHSRARANGGGDHANNLLPACCDCNNEKSTGSTRAARARAGHGRTRAPMSKAKKTAAKQRNAVVGGLGLGALGALFGGPAGAVIGGIAGAALGGSADPEK